MVATRGTQGKRAADGTASRSSPTNKRVKTDNDKKEKDQKTIEETLNGAEDVIEDDGAVARKLDNKLNGSQKTESASGNSKHEDTEMIDEKVESEEKENTGSKNGASDVKKEEPKHHEKSDQDEDKNEKTALDDVKSDEKDVKKSAKDEEAKKAETMENNGESVVENVKREDAMPSSILEKGIIYFFYRGRVNIEEPEGVDDIARSYMVLRPLPIGAKIGEGPLEDAGNARLLALPKKVLPKSNRDRFLVFVEKANSSIKDLKDNFMTGSDYATKTAGTSHTPPVSPLAEGVYAITTTGRESHLAYHITIPSPFPTDSNSVQQSLGLNERGSYVLSAKNPTASGPAKATLDNPADYPEHIMKKFRGLRWMPLVPELLDYENTQMLIIGEGMGETDKAVEEQGADRKDETKDTPREEMDKLEEEDHARIQGLEGSDKDAIFADLGLSSKEYPQLQTTW